MVQLPAEMMDGPITVVSSQCGGIQSFEGRPVAMTQEYADSGLGPVGAACIATGMQPHEAREGTQLLHIVGGKDHDVTAIGEKLGLAAPVERAQADAPVISGAALPGKTPDGPAR